MQWIHEPLANLSNKCTHRAAASTAGDAMDPGATCQPKQQVYPPSSPTELLQPLLGMQWVYEPPANLSNKCTHLAAAAGAGSVAGVIDSAAGMNQGVILRWRNQDEQRSDYKME
eukprot:1157945-Pelagomonas_calceolata.AAC.8